MDEQMNMFLVGTDGDDILVGEPGNNTIEGGLGNDSLIGGANNDRIVGGIGDDIIIGGLDLGGDLTSLASIGGRDTLEGGSGNDIYLVSLTASGGSEIRDEQGETDILLIFAENTAIDTTSPDVDDIDNSAIFGDSIIELSLPEAGIVGLQKSDTNLIIDLNRDGIAEAENDLTIFNFFDEQGQLGNGSLLSINNITDTQSIVDFFAANAPVSSENDLPSTVYRFFNNDTGVHFYTASVAERDFVDENLSNFTSEGASYRGVDPLTGTPEPLPVYRFLNQDTGVHLYTIDENERNFVQNELSNFSFEGEAFFAYTTPVEGTIPIYRFFNSTSGAHFYTPSTSERDFVESDLPDFQSEGIAYYALPIE